MKVQKMLLGLITIFALMSCGQNPALEKKINKSLNERVASPLTPDLKDGTEIVKKLGLKDIDFGEIELNQKVSSIMRIENLNPKLLDSAEFNVIDTDQVITDFIIQTGNDLDEHTFVKISYTPSSLGDKKMTVIASVISEGQEVELVGNIFAKVVTNVEVTEGLKLYIEEQRNLLFDPITIGSSATKDVLIENPSINTAYLESLSFENGTNFSYELIDVISGSECDKKVNNSCFLRIKFSPITFTDLHDTLTVTHTYNGKTSRVLKINLRGLIAKYSNICTNSAQRMYFPIIKNELNSIVKIKLPYFVKSKKTSKKIEVLVNQETNYSQTYLENNLDFVQDAQVLTSFNLSSDNALGSVTKVEFASSLLKNFDVTSKKFRLTEVLCLENTMSCSGEFFQDLEYKNHINGKYSIANTNFLDIIMSEGRQLNVAGHEFMDYSGVMNLNFLSEDIGRSIRGQSKVNIVIADDIKLQKLPALLVNYQKEIHNECN